MKRKVFGIGLNKTGTTTLGSCLKALGYKHTSYNIEMLRMFRAGRLDVIHSHCCNYDSFEDWPYPLLYRELDQWFPESRFILTSRESAAIWLTSLEQHSLRVDPDRGCETREIVYGTPYPQLERMSLLSMYRDHLERVRDYFKDRPEKLLEVCWEKGSGWQQLCSFLECDVPRHIDFPHANRASKPEEAVLRENLRRLEQFQRSMA